MRPRIGIEKLGAYPGSLVLPMRALFEARGHDYTQIRDVMMIDERSVNPGWEDPVTMVVNAAKPLLTDADRERIGLLIVASESGVDQEKPISTWVQRYLGLSSGVRNIEVKHACYGSTASLQLAAGWIASGVAPGEAALVINTDQSRMHLGKPWEYVLGAAAVAVLVSDTPKVLEIELGAYGVHTNEVSDLTRPTPHVETGNSETSLLSYLDGLEGALDDYLRRRPEAADLDGHFARNIYHLPFGGMGYRAHKAVLRRGGTSGRDEVREDFARKTLHSLAFVRRMGGTYGASTFLALMALIDTDADLRAGDRVGIFSYGSGSCASCGADWSVRKRAKPCAPPGCRRCSTPGARCPSPSMKRSRRRALRSSTAAITIPIWPPLAVKKGLLVFRGMREFYRQYGWS